MVWLEDRAAGAQTGDLPVAAYGEKALDLVGSGNLKPRLYRFRLWTAYIPTVKGLLMISTSGLGGREAAGPADVLDVECEHERLVFGSLRLGVYERL